MQNWESTIDQPTLTQLNRVGAKSWDNFVDAGRTISAVIEKEIVTFFQGLGRRPTTLDFGCGVGRVFLPLHFRDFFDLLGCDVDPDAVRYLRRVAAPADVRRSNYDPPLQFPDAAFDCVYSVSIWTHLNPRLGIRWLHEIKRVLKPGGLALITTSGYRALATRHKRGDKGWDKVSDEGLKREGIIFIEYERFRSQPAAYPGITASYGLTAHDPDYVKREWSTIMPVVSVQQAVIANVQDLVTMVRP